MRDNALQFTMREMQRVAASPLPWAALAGAALVLGMVGPFGTYESLRLPARLAYWAAIVVSTYFLGFAVVSLLEKAIFAKRPGPAGFALIGAMAGVPVALFVWVLNRLVYGTDVVFLLPLTLYVMAIAAVSSGVIAFFSARLAHAPAPAQPSAQRPKLIERLQPRLRGKLLYLSMQDHYVEVVTDKGSELILMRMSDAVDETAPVEGLQIHRSYWVASNAVTGTTRRDGRLILRMSDGAELPVSRNRIGAVKDAGLA
ncbi:LytTR family DNA-binding domain-containing protein [Neoaquamicrobium sediminum]|uniref:LytTR family DNA-binding domain-containing protein n=1 Tax=Neoaquamicrobium sediminum TaxID=1849104 RepID=UPI001565520B|nr:LytTR family DNA-binding domain-containing protein [Mesorhizobium sediminum]NRC55278.1 LytTR family transcriptional regulator [Mesorhizobium sediminum]